MSRLKALKRVRRLGAARARLHADAPPATLFDRLPRRPVIWPKTTLYQYEPEAQHRAKLEALLAQATKAAPRYHTRVNGERVELPPGVFVEPFRRMTEEQRRSLPLKLPVTGPRCAACGGWAKWEMLRHG